jgi:hypothetical protein
MATMAVALLLTIYKTRCGEKTLSNFFIELASQNYAFQIQIASVPIINFPNHFGKLARIWTNRSSQTGAYREIFFHPSKVLESTRCRTGIMTS